MINKIVYHLPLRKDDESEHCNASLFIKFYVTGHRQT